MFLKRDIVNITPTFRKKIVLFCCRELSRENGKHNWKTKPAPRRVCAVSACLRTYTRAFVRAQERKNTATATRQGRNLLLLLRLLLLLSQFLSFHKLDKGQTYKISQRHVNLFSHSLFKYTTGVLEILLVDY